MPELIINVEFLEALRQCTGNSVRTYNLQIRPAVVATSCEEPPTVHDIKKYQSLTDYVKPGTAPGGVPGDEEVRSRPRKMLEDLSKVTHRMALAVGELPSSSTPMKDRQVQAHSNHVCIHVCIQERARDNAWDHMHTVLTMDTLCQSPMRAI